MESPREERVDLAVHRLQGGFRSRYNAESEQRALKLAERLASESITVAQFERETREFAAHELSVSVDTARRLRKATEIVQDDIGVNIGHSRFARAATNLATLSSLGSVVLSGSNLLRASDSLWTRYRQTADRSAISDGLFETFYQALAIFIIDCMLFSSPLNYKTAWRGTRYLNNRCLYRLRKVAPNLHRYVLSEVHYVIREIVPAVLHSAVEYSTYLVSLTVSTVQSLWEFGSLGLREVQSTAEDLLEEFQEFSLRHYSFEPPTIDLGALSGDVMTKVATTIEVS